MRFSFTKREHFFDVWFSWYPVKSSRVDEWIWLEYVDREAQLVSKNTYQYWYIGRSKECDTPHKKQPRKR